MRGRLVLYIDQYGEHIWARTVADLREQAGGGTVSKMYCDLKDGRTVHQGYVVGKLWFRAFIPYEGAA